MARKKKKKRTFVDVLSGLLLVVALCVFVYAGYSLFGFYKEYKKSSDEYDNLESSYVVPEQTENFDVLENDEVFGEVSGGFLDSEGLEELENLDGMEGREVITISQNGQEMTLPLMTNPIDFTELQRVNDDIVGWLRIRALDISYPVVQSEDNDFYLHRTFEKTDNFAGCLFVNCENNPDLTDQNTVIYGHNMKNGSMFGKLKLFREEGTFEKSKYFWIFAPDFIYEYRIFSACVVDKTGLTYQTGFNDEEFRAFIEHAFTNSEVDTSGVEVTQDDRIVTLSTCTGDDATRFTVMGKLVQIYVSRQSPLAQQETQTQSETQPQTQGQG